jgi:predicted metalloprotease with PDZ domain
MRWLSQSLYDMAQVLFNTLYGKRREIVEALLLAALGPMFGADNAHQIAQALQTMSQSTLYRRLHAITLHQLRQTLEHLLVVPTKQ